MNGRSRFTIEVLMGGGGCVGGVDHYSGWFCPQVTNDKSNNGTHFFIFLVGGVG